MSTDYTGRSVDLLIFQGLQPTGETQVALALGSAGEVVTGIQKLSQSFTSIFLTDIGSIHHDPTVGTSFVSSMRQGRLQDEMDLKSEFALAVENVRQQLALALDATNPPPADEIFASATLRNFNMDREASKITLVVALTSAAGESREVIMPVSLAIK